MPLRFLGVNCYRLAEFHADADSILGFLATNGVRVVRFWAFQKHCGPTGTDFTKFDSLFAAARRHDLLLVPVLENHWDACTYGPTVKPPDWYAGGWRHDPLGAPIPYLDYLRAMARRYRDEPQILCWQLVNEPEIYPDTDAHYRVLSQFARDASRELKAIDRNHLVSLGLLGLGQPATAGKRFRALHQFPSIDLVTAHDYGYIHEPMPGRDWKWQENHIHADLLDARSLKKPFVVTEAGIPLEWVGGDRAQRAELFRAKIESFFEAGTSGYLLWNYEPQPDTDHGFDADDPVFTVLREISSQLRRT